MIVDLDLISCIFRSRNGWNNNPNCLQFMRTYKRLLVHQDLRSNTGNCIAQDQTNILTFTSTREKLDITKVHMLRNREEDNVEEIEEDVKLSLPIHFNEYSENVITYISGFVIRKIQKRIKCPKCIEALHFSEDIDYMENSLKLINRKSKGGLLLPSKSLQEVCKIVENKIQVLLEIEKHLPPKKIFIESLLKYTNKITFDDNLFRSLKDHSFDFGIEEDSHKKLLISEIIKVYSSIRIFSITKKINEDISGEKIRKSLNKLILFKHQ